MFRQIKGLTGRLTQGYDVLTEFDGWLAIANWNGEPGTEDTRPGARLNVARHTPDDLTWSLREAGELKVELDIAGRVFVSDARILFEQPTLQVEILGALEPQ